MEKLHFSIEINAPAEKIWKVLWDDPSYRKWTAAFSEGGYAVTDWNEGSKVLFLGPEGDGMHSIIMKHVPEELMIFKHLGEMRNGHEVPIDETKENWSGSLESYLLTGRDVLYTLTVNLDTTDEFAEYFRKTFPIALEKVKELAEAA